MTQVHDGPRTTSTGEASTGEAAPSIALGAAHWRFRQTATLVVIDATLILVAVTLALVGRFGELATVPGGSLYLVLGAGLWLGWLLVLAATGAYESRFFGSGPEEYKRVISASLRTVVLFAFGLYLVKQDAARGFVFGASLIGLALLIVGRYLARVWLVRRRFQGQLTHRLIAVGAPASIDELVLELAGMPHAGLTIVGACTTDPSTEASPGGVPTIGTLDNVAAVARAMDADAVVITSAVGINPRVIREIAWSLEGMGVDLIIAPSLSGVAGPRITMRPIGGLALLHVEEPAFTGARRRVKALTDLAAAALGVLLLSPVLLTVAALIRLTSSGPAIYRQTRIGLNGKEFRVFKFRTMYTDAEHRLAELLDRNEGDGLLFKIKDDPRITPIGNFLRSTSIDELPQLLNILLGHMSLVGPRPLPVADSAFEGHVRRRLLVKPGITGLWQISGGRSDQSWDEAVRLDLNYVENWSISLDLAILARTLVTVARRDGAY